MGGGAHNRNRASEQAAYLTFPVVLLLFPNPFLFWFLFWVVAGAGVVASVCVCLCVCVRECVYV